MRIGAPRIQLIVRRGDLRIAEVRQNRLALATGATSSNALLMAQTATLYRMRLELSDIDRGVYETLELRVARHPSEGDERVVARVLAYALLYEPGLEFGKGLSDAEEPALWTHDLTGQLTHWIDVGTPGAERIHIASKKAGKVSILCHKEREGLTREMQKRKVHGADNISVLYVEPSLVTALAEHLDRNAAWTIVHTDGELSITLNDATFAGSVTRTALPQ